ncbi:MAG: helix-turn-helix domain-containing protein [Acidimicrobiales bacterium]
MRTSDAVFSPRLAGLVLEAFTNESGDATPLPSGDPDLDQMTAPERHVLRLIARGHAYTSVARELDIAPTTVESQVSLARRKLQLSNRYQLPNWASAAPHVIVDASHSALGAMPFMNSALDPPPPDAPRVTSP